MAYRQRKNNRNDAVIQIVTKQTHLATIALWMQKKGVFPRSKSELGRIMIEYFSDYLVSIGEQLVTSTGEAVEILESMDIGGFNPQGRYGFSLSEKLRDEGDNEMFIEMERINRSRQRDAENDQRNAENENLKPLSKEAQAILRDARTIRENTDFEYIRNEMKLIEKHIQEKEQRKKVKE